jgi:PIN domain nuclease of toxin-antitoxin system
MAVRFPMNVLLDTCALLALARGELPRESSAALRSAPEACISTVSAWEIAIKVQARKLQLKEPALDWFLAIAEQYDLRELALDARIACTAATLPPIHHDPFDRVLVAVARMNAFVILTSDKNIAKYPGLKTIW